MAKRRYTKRRTRRRKTKKGGSKRRVKRKRKRKRTRRRKQKGGGCPYNKNMGEYFTLRKYNSNPSLPDPISTNFNSSVPIPYRKSGGKRSKRTKSRKNQKGGSGWYDYGFSDLINSYFDGSKTVTDLPLKWRGKKTQLGANPMKQKINTPRIQHQIPDIEAHHRSGITQAANYGTVGAQ